MKRTLLMSALVAFAGFSVGCGALQVGPTSEQATQTAFAAATTVAPPPTVAPATPIPTDPPPSPTVTLIVPETPTTDPALVTPATPDPAVATPADVAQPSPTVFATPTTSSALNYLAVSDPSKNAVIAGTIFVPNRAMVPAMLIFAQEPIEGWYHFVETLPGTTTFSMEVAVHPNPYYVFAYPLDGTSPGAYTEAAKCGAHPTLCTDHRLIKLPLTPGEIRKDVNVWDWEQVTAVQVPAAPIQVPVKDYSYLTDSAIYPTVVGTTTTQPQTATPATSNTPDPNATATITSAPTATPNYVATGTALAGTTPQAGATPTVSNNALAEGKGRVTGAVSYPTGVTEVVVYAVRADSKYVYFIPNPGEGYEMDLEAGKWVIFAYPRGAETGNLAGGYTAGGASLSQVTVNAEEVLTGINIDKWAQNTFPPAPFVPPAGQN